MSSGKPVSVALHYYKTLFTIYHLTVYHLRRLKLSTFFISCFPLVFVASDLGDLVTFTGMHFSKMV
jgi:hypothetical protein